MWRSVVDGMLKLKNCTGAEDIQSVDSEHDMNMTDSWWTASALNAADAELRVQTENDPLNRTHPEHSAETKRYRHWSDTEHYRLWTPLTPNTRLNTTDTEQ